jgi:aspartate oxidase
MSEFDAPASVVSEVVAAALAREESRGSHTRSDAPGARDEWLGRLVIHGDGAPRFVELPALAPTGESVSGA